MIPLPFTGGDAMKCQYCGSENPISNEFCNACGGRLNKEQEQLSVEKNDSITSNSTKIEYKIPRVPLFPYILGFVIVAGILSLLFSLSEDSPSSTGILVIASILSVIALFASYGKAKNKAKEFAVEQSKNLQKTNQTLEKYDEIKNLSNVPYNSKIISYSKLQVGLGTKGKRVFIWKQDDNLCFFPTTPDAADNSSIDNIKKTIIPIKAIECFSTKGEIFRENKISGGGGGGSSIKGAVIGSMIAGDVGAVIGSRKGVNEIKSELITHDTRETVLDYFSDGMNKQSLSFTYEAFAALKDLIPEKEYAIVNSIKSSQIINKQFIPSEMKNVTDQIRELAKLKEEGLITEQEFAEKKKQLLDKIG